MTGVESSPRERFLRIMGAGAQAILDATESPYWIAEQLRFDLGPVLTEADFAGAAFEVWGGLTDAIDGPPRYSRGLDENSIDGLMRRAATEWLALDPTPATLKQYFERWREWPDSIWPGEFHRWSDRDHLPPAIVKREAEAENGRYHAAIQRAAASIDNGWSPYAVAQKLQEIAVKLRPEAEPVPQWAETTNDLIKKWADADSDRRDIERRIREMVADLQND